MNNQTERWDAFLAAHENSDLILDDEKHAMFKGWLGRTRLTVDKYHTALWQWRA